MNYETFLEDENDLMRFMQIIDLILLDEVTKIKNPEAQRSVLIKRCTRHIKYKFALTATPIGNGLEDLYSVIDFLS